MRKLKPITVSDIDQLLTASAALASLDGRLLEEWGGGNRASDGAIEMPYPVYPEIVEDFFRAAGAEPWSNYNYVPEDAARMVRDRTVIANASLDDIRTMLTWCVRGERFCDGHWAHVLADGTIGSLLARLKVLRDNAAPRSS